MNAKSNLCMNTSVNFTVAYTPKPKPGDLLEGENLGRLRSEDVSSAVARKIFDARKSIQRACTLWPRRCRRSRGAGASLRQ